MHMKVSLSRVSIHERARTEGGVDTPIGANVHVEVGVKAGAGTQLLTGIVAAAAGAADVGVVRFETGAAVGLLVNYADKQAQN